MTYSPASCIAAQHIMANYYHEARAHAKSIRLMQDDNRKRAERRAEKAGVEVQRSVGPVAWQPREIVFDAVPFDVIHCSHWQHIG